jgi:hypothetical protein
MKDKSSGDKDQPENVFLCFSLAQLGQVTPQVIDIQ